MYLLNCINKVPKVTAANLNDMVSQVEYPETILEQSLIEIQKEMVQIRLYIANLLGIQKCIQRQYSQAQSQANKWYQRARIALLEGDEGLAREALHCKLNYNKVASMLQNFMDEQVAQVNSLKRELVTLERKVSEARIKKDILKARSQAVKHYEVSRKQ